MRAVVGRTGPTEHAPRVVAADEDVVGNVEVARTCELRRHTDADPLDAVVADGQSLRARDVLHAGPERDFGIANREAFEDVMVGGHDVEQPERAVAVEDDLAVAGGFDRDRFLGRALGSQQVRPVERQPVLIDVVAPIALVESRVYEVGVARLRFVKRNDVPIAGADVAVVRRHQAREVRLLLGTFPGERIDVQHAAAGRSLRLRARSHGRRLHRLSSHAVRILHRQPDFIGGVGRKIENAACETVGHRVGCTEDPFAAHAEERQRFRPGRVAGFPVGDVDRRIPVRIAGDRPLEAEVDQRGGLDDELTGGHAVLGLGGTPAHRKSINEQPTKRSRGPQQSHHTLHVDHLAGVYLGSAAGIVVLSLACLF